MGFSLASQRLKDLQDLAVRWAMEPDSHNKTMFGFWLHGELADLDEKGLIKEDDKIDFLATVKILIEQILPQPIGDD